MSEVQVYEVQFSDQYGKYEIQPCGICGYEPVKVVRLEDYAALQQQLTATTNILKSAGIEADTVQAGVMELVSRMNQVVAEYHQLRTYALSNLVPADHNSDDELPSFERCDAYLNAVRADTERMNYLVGKVVNVREPMVYGSNNIFWAQCISGDSEPYETTLREQIDAQIRNTIPAMAPVVQERRSYQPGKWIVVREEDRVIVSRSLTNKGAHDFADAVTETTGKYHYVDEESCNGTEDLAAQLRTGNAGKDGSHE